MKFTSTRELCDHTFGSINFRKHRLIFLLTNLSLFTFLYTTAGEIRTDNNSQSHQNAFIGNVPMTGTESLRTNLYLLNISNNSTILADGVLTEYNNLYHDNVTLEDAYKFTNINENLGITRYSATLAVERRPIISLADTIFFKLWKTTQRHYQFEFVATNLFHPGMEATLQDSYLGTSTILSLTGTTKVNFFVNSNVASGSVNRFKIIYSTNSFGTTLPLTFTSIKGYQLDSKVAIDWKIENEISIARYEVEHSLTGTNFRTVNTIGAIGTNTTLISYTSIHSTPVIGNNFYRIKSIDKNGLANYSAIIKVVTGKPGSGSIAIYPNPVKGNSVNLQFTNQLTGMYHVKLINSNGQTVYSNKMAINSANVSQVIVINKQLRFGIYQLEILKPDNTIEIKKAIVQ